MPSENDKISKFNQYVKSENTACLTNNGCTIMDLVTNLYDKTESIIHIRNLKQELNHGLILIKINKVIKSLAKVVF